MPVTLSMLKALTLFKSENGGGRYCGAYRDYRDMMQTTLELLSGASGPPKFAFNLYPLYAGGL